MDAEHTIKDILRPRGLLERYRRDPKISRSRLSTLRNHKKVADQASALEDIPPRSEANSSAEIRRFHTQRGLPGGPSFSAARQTALRLQSFSNTR